MKGTGVEDKGRDNSEKGVCVCVAERGVRERDREIEREGERKTGTSN